MGSDYSPKGKHNLSRAKNQQGQSSELRENLISCASGELNKAVDESCAEGDGDVRVDNHRFLEGLQYRGRSRWTASNQTGAVINSA